jgi:hypothetical protein
MQLSFYIGLRSPNLEQKDSGFGKSSSRADAPG